MDMSRIEEVIKQNISKKSILLALSIIIMSLILAFGMGYAVANNDNPAPIIINQNS